MEKAGSQTTFPIRVIESPNIESILAAVSIPQFFRVVYFGGGNSPIMALACRRCPAFSRDIDMSVETDRRLTRREAADFLTGRGYRVAPATLAKYATVGGGPIFESFGRRPIYKPADLLAWVTSKSTGPRRSTSDKQAG